MSTEIKLGDLLQSWNTVKWSGKLTMGLVKGTMYLGKKALSSSQNDQHTDVIIPAIQSQNSHGIIFGKQDGKYIIKPESEDGHIMVVGGVGAAKVLVLLFPL